MPKKNDGVYKNTKAGLVESGALTREDLDYDNQSTPAAAPTVKPVRGLDKQISQAEYDATVPAKKAAVEANYLKYKQGGFKRNK